MSEQWDNVYAHQVQIYEDLSKYEDANNKAFNRLMSLASFEGKTVLEIGCGSGKYTAAVACRAARYYALDLSMPLLEMARDTCKDQPGVAWINASAALIPLPDNSVDILFASWAFPPYDVMEESFAEVTRVLKDCGEIWLIGNWPEGEFTDMRDEASNRAEWGFIEWYTKKGIETVEIVDSNFCFPDLAYAQRVLGFILGQRAVDYLEQHRNPRVRHRIAIHHGRIAKLA